MFDPPDHSVCQSISFVLYVQFRIRSFNVMCLQLIYNYFNFTNLIQIRGKDLSVTGPEKYSSTCF